MSQLISIILPIYNGEKYMRQSIDSVLAQTYGNWELLIVDDGSTDRTAEIAMEYVQKDLRIQYHKNPQNMRLPRTLNRGFSMAKGAYLTWTSDDNYYYPTALEKMYHALESEKKHFCFASCDVINENGQIVDVIAVNEKSGKIVVGHNTVGACFLYSREAYQSVGEYDTEMTLVEDYDYWQRICMKYDPVCISENLYAYRWHDGALTSTMSKQQHASTLERMLIKNRPGFGRINWEAKYYFYRGLHNCRKILGKKIVSDEFKFQALSMLNFLLRRVPNKIKRMAQR
jgi:glycosyltransferase involved in cell wall biosynthesis